MDICRGTSRNYSLNLVSYAVFFVSGMYLELASQNSAIRSYFRLMEYFQTPWKELSPVIP